MEIIRGLEQLKYNLSLGPGYGGYSDLLKAIDFSEKELKQFLQFGDEHYQRVRLYDSKLIEAILTCWKPSQEGGIHNFNGSVSWFKVISGTIILENFDLNRDAPKLKYTQILKSGEQCFIDDEHGFHRFRNETNTRCVILHLYAEKMLKRRVYHPENGKVKLVSTEVDKNLDT